jgi:hypothetical protein
LTNTQTATEETRLKNAGYKSVRMKGKQYRSPFETISILSVYQAANEPETGLTHSTIYNSL